MPNRLRARELLRRKSVWIPPIVIGVVLIGLTTALYIGSAVDPVDHMDGLPVSLVQRDAGGSSIGGIEVNLGRQVEGALLGAPEVSEKLDIHVESMAAAEDRMDRGASYATLVVPPDFTDAALNLVGAPGRHPARPGLPTVRLLTNQRAGTEGAGLASGVLDPALAAISQSLGHRLLIEAGPRAGTAARAALADPVEVEAVQYRPLPAKAALGLSAFYTALLVLMCGFIGATIVNSFLDGALGFAPTEIGPKWTMARPTLISRWQTLLAKWAMAAVLTGFFAAISHLDPLRQILGGVRSILYLEARGDAGLTEGAIATAVGLVFWTCVGAFFVRRYDRAGRDRMDPDLLAYVHQSADEYRDSRSS